MCVIRVGNTGTTSNSEVTEVALNITTSKKDENCTVDCLEPFDLIFKMTIRSNSIKMTSCVYFWDQEQAVIHVCKQCAS